MDSSTKMERKMNSPVSPPKNVVPARCSMAASDSMKDMDWLDSIELKMLNDTTKAGCVDNQKVCTHSCSLEQSFTDSKNDSVEKNDTNPLSLKSIRNIVDKIRSKSTKEEIDVQLLGKLTKLLNVSPNSSAQTMENNENTFNSSTTDEGDSDHKTIGSEQSISKTNPNDNYTMNDEVQNLLTSKISPSRGDNVFDEDKLKPLDYKNDNTLKPPYSYSTLIKMAMKSNHKECITLLNIYDWIKTNFAYYRNVDSCWQNSIRHNLSLNKCFVRVPRESGDHGKGGYWRYVESNDTSDSRYSTKTYSRSLSTGMSTLNCYRSKKYHRRNNKNLSVIVQPFDQFQPQQPLQSFANEGALQNQLFNQFASQLNTTNNNLYGYQNPFVSSPSSNIYRVQSYCENNPPMNMNSNTFPQLRPSNSGDSSLEIPSIYSGSIMPNQGILPNSNMIGNCEQQLTTDLTNIGSNTGEVNPILEAMKYPITYYNNMNNSAANHNFSNGGETMGNNNIVNSGGVEKNLTQSFMDNTAPFRGDNTSLPVLLCNDSSERYSMELLNSLAAAAASSSATNSFDSLQNLQGNNSISTIANNHNNISGGFTDMSSGSEYKSFSSITSSNSSTLDGNDLYNYYLNELSILQRQQPQQQPNQQINPQIQRLYNALGGNNFYQC